jgi:GNAT superfamily N-acetyltransferase
MPQRFTFVRITDELPADLEGLANAAEAEGYNHIHRMLADWRDGKERFTSDGCLLLAVYTSDGDAPPKAVAVGGVTCDPFLQDSLRLRRFYVHPDIRRQGLGESLASALIHEAVATGKAVVVHAGDARAARFWESLGFSQVQGASHTHHLTQAGKNRPDPAKAPA